jgi:hypothetical protein
MWNAAGPDEYLARAVISARSARSGGVAEVLAESRTDFGLRAWRSQVLGAACTDTDVVERWLRDSPRDPDALLLYARTAVARALRSADKGDRRWEELAHMARRACTAAIDAAPQDPTPLVTLLSLARLGHTPRPDPAGRADVQGPWDLFDRVRALDPLNREGHLRFLHCLDSDTAMLNFAIHIASSTPLDSDPQLLMLVAQAEHYRAATSAEHEQLRADEEWRSERVLRFSLDLHELWFPKARERRFLPIVDFSYLAHALWAGGRPQQARDVLRAMEPYAVPQPWSLFGDPERVLLRARAECRLGPRPGGP